MTTFRKLLTTTLTLLAGTVLIQQAVAQRGGGGGRGGARGPTPTTLKAVTTGEKAVDEHGFIRRWLILDPINIGNQQTEGPSKAAAHAEYFPNQLTVIPHDGDKVTVNGQELTWRALDTLFYNVNLYNYAAVYNTSAAGALFWAVTIVNCPEDMPNVRLAIGSNASSVWWIDGKEVCGIYGDRQTVIDDGVSKRLTLKKGPNVVRCVVINGSGAADFCARFIDENDKPVMNLTSTLTR
jgi:hypothetical protein